MKEQAQIESPPTPWFVYILLCSDQTLYTGITTDISRRLAQHNSTKGGSRYTRSRQPVRLLYVEPAATRSHASKREFAIKAMNKKHKLQIIASESNLLK